MRILSFCRSHKQPYGWVRGDSLKSTHDWPSLTQFLFTVTCVFSLSIIISLGLTHPLAFIPSPSPPPYSLLNMQFNLANLLFIKKKTSPTSQGEDQKLYWPLRPWIISLCPTTSQFFKFISYHSLQPCWTLLALNMLCSGLLHRLFPVWNAIPFI